MTILTFYQQKFESLRKGEELFSILEEGGGVGVGVGVVSKKGGRQISKSGGETKRGDQDFLRKKA